MSLSFRIIKTFGLICPVWLNASNAIPAVIAPSPITATFFFSDSAWEATAMPRSALIDVLECPTPNESYSLSEIEGKGASPPFFRIVWIWFFLPVRILWGYAWCPTSHTKLSNGVFKR